jgi:hypothetical protein
MILLRISRTGPVFNGLAKRAARDFARAASLEVAKEGQRLWIVQLDSSIKVNTGYYTSNVQITTAGNNNIVHDSGVVYGPWLEGVGSRNYPVTRFRGYHSMRRAKAKLDRAAPRIAERVLQRFLPRMR